MDNTKIFNNEELQKSKTLDKPGMYKIQPWFMEPHGIFKIGVGSKLGNRLRDYGLYWPPKPGSDYSYKIHELVTVPRVDDRFYFTTKQKTFSRESKVKKKIIAQNMSYKPHGSGFGLGSEWLKEEKSNTRSNKTLSLGDDLNGQDTYYHFANNDLLTKYRKAGNAQPRKREKAKPKSTRASTRLMRKGIFDGEMSLDNPILRK